MVSRLITTCGGFLGEELWVSQVIAFVIPCPYHTPQRAKLMVAIEYTSTVLMLMLSELASVGRASLAKALGRKPIVADGSARRLQRGGGRGRILQIYAGAQSQYG